jgi:hypothetical protein
MTGPAHIRHPQYVGFVVIMFGFFVAMADSDYFDPVPHLGNGLCPACQT